MRRSASVVRLIAGLFPLIADELFPLIAEGVLVGVLFACVPICSLCSLSGWHGEQLNVRLGGVGAAAAGKRERRGEGATGRWWWKRGRRRADAEQSRAEQKRRRWRRATRAEVEEARSWPEVEERTAGRRRPSRAEQGGGGCAGEGRGSGGVGAEQSS